jgi:hypothetical protein
LTSPTSAPSNGAVPQRRPPPPTFRSSIHTTAQRIGERELHLAPVRGGVEIERDDPIVAVCKRATNAATPRCAQASRSTNDVSMP